MSGIIYGFAGSRARVRLFYTRCNFTRGHNVKPAPVPVGTNTNPYPHPTGFLPLHSGCHSLISTTPCLVLQKQERNNLFSAKSRSLKYSSHNLTLRSDRSAMIDRPSFPSGVVNLLAPFQDQQARRGAPCSASTLYWSDRYGSPVRLVSPGRSGERPTNVARAGSRRGGAHRVVLVSAGQLGHLQTSRR
jgi:hypothetical protein